MVKQPTVFDCSLEAKIFLGMVLALDWGSVIICLVMAPLNHCSQLTLWSYSCILQIQVYVQPLLTTTKDKKKKIKHTCVLAFIIFTHSLFVYTLYNSWVFQDFQIPYTLQNFIKFHQLKLILCRKKKNLDSIFEYI